MQTERRQDNVSTVCHNSLGNFIIFKFLSDGQFSNSDAKQSKHQKVSIFFQENINKAYNEGESIYCT